MNEEYPKQYLYRQVVRAKLYIDQNFASDIDLGNIAAEACFSKFHFSRLFRTIYGRTPHQYLTLVRVYNATKLLDQGATVKAACFAVGFDSVSSFTGLFRRWTGLTPAPYRRDRQERRSEIVNVPLKHIPNCFAEKKGWAKNSNIQ